MKGLPPAASAALFLGAFGLAACTPPAPDTLARSEESSTVLAPVTTAPLATTSAPPSTRATIQPPSSARELSPSDGSDSDASAEGEDGEELDLPNLTAIGVDLQTVLGPTTNVRATLLEVIGFPPGSITPSDAVITEISIGAGTPNDEGTVLTQVSVSISTSLDSVAAFNQQTSAATASGMYPIDSTSNSTDDPRRRSASFRQVGGDQFDEFVISATPNGEEAILRLTATSNLTTGSLSRYINWIDGSSPLPSSEEQTTLVVVRTSGEGRLALTTMTVESAVLQLETSPQREANRLVGRLVESSRFSFGGDPDLDQALSGVVGFDGLDRLIYEVEPTLKTIVDSEGELVEEEAVIVRLRGEVTLAD